MPDERAPQLPQEDGRGVVFRAMRIASNQLPHIFWGPAWPTATGRIVELVPASLVAALRDEVERLRSAYEIERKRKYEALQERGNAQTDAAVAEAEVARLTARLEETEREAMEHWERSLRSVRSYFDVSPIERAAEAVAQIVADRQVLDAVRAEGVEQERRRLAEAAARLQADAEHKRSLVDGNAERFWAGFGFGVRELADVLSEEGASSDGD